MPWDWTLSAGSMFLKFIGLFWQYLAVHSKGFTTATNFLISPSSALSPTQSTWRGRIKSTRISLAQKGAGESRSSGRINFTRGGNNYRINWGNYLIVRMMILQSFLGTGSAGGSPVNNIN